ncbi:MAG: helix-hairpin-helix domain-containing protein [Marinifilaceae bacterium]|jgi:hypothetical protein|nr:helix-hairpin-helix domain-containing protein [Marinifilaceae bacterium]
MLIKYILIICCVNILITKEIFSQNELNRSQIVERLIERWGERENLNTDEIEELNQYVNKPVNINSLKESELSNIPILNEQQVVEIIKYREKVGKILSIYEFLYLDNFPFSTVKLLSYMLVFEDTESGGINIKKQYGDCLHKFVFNNKDKPSAYQASSFYYSVKTRGSVDNKLKYNFVAENDIGEDFFNSNNKRGFDFYSAYLSYTNKRTKLIIGDYHIANGQGLAYWTNYGGAKSSLSINNCYKSPGIKGKNSTEENIFLRGIAIRRNLSRKISLISFYSNKKRDASYNNSPTNPFYKLQNTGYHRSKTEKLNKSALREQTAGLIFKYSSMLGRFSFYITNSNFSKYIGVDNYYNFYNPRLKSFYIAGFSYIKYYNHVLFYGEYARNKKNKTAIIQGIEFQISNNFKLDLIYRNYKPGYRSIHSRSFGEFSRTENEKGVYFGVQYDIARNIVLRSYYDSYQTHWLVSDSSSPSQGEDYLAEINYSIDEQTKLYFRYKNEYKTKTLSNELDRSYSQEEERIKQYRINYSSQILSNLKYNIRFQFNSYKFSKTISNGELSMIDLYYNIKMINIFLRYALFDTDDYNSGIYAYEKDLYQSFYIPKYSFSGSRLVLCLNYKMAKKFHFYFKFSKSKLRTEGKESYNEQKFLLRYKF